MGRAALCTQTAEVISQMLEMSDSLREALRLLPTSMDFFFQTGLVNQWAPLAERFYVSLFVRRDQFLFVSIDNKHGQQACGLSVTVICTDGMMIARYFGPALASAIVTLDLSVVISTVDKSSAEATLTERAAKATPQRNLVNMCVLLR